jgi:hypothetical protein
MMYFQNINLGNLFNVAFLPRMPATFTLQQQYNYLFCLHGLNLIEPHGTKKAPIKTKPTQGRLVHFKGLCNTSPMIYMCSEWGIFGRTRPTLVLSAVEGPHTPRTGGFQPAERRNAMPVMQLPGLHQYNSQ